MLALTLALALALAVPRRRALFLPAAKPAWYERFALADVGLRGFLGVLFASADAF